MNRVASLEWRPGETVRDEAAPAAAGISFAEGSFVERVPSADTYVLGTIIHDRPDEDAAAILETIEDGLVTCRSR
ncbi:MAG: methyltransferase [Verrucomicrobiota bacterium]